MKSNYGNRFINWLDDRYKIKTLLDYMSKKDVPINRDYVWYYFGGVTLFLFIVLVISGMLLLFYYQPGVNTAYESIKHLMANVEWGWLVRSVHSWAANLMVFTGFVHMFSVLLTRAYRKPRELTWMTGVVLLLLAMFAGFSGYLLPWSKLSFFAVEIGTELPRTIPIFGDFMVEVMRGGPDVTGATLHRFLGFHITIIPIIFISILALHLLFVQRQGMSEPFVAKGEKPEEPMKKSMKFFPNFFLRDVVIWIVVLNVLVLLAVFFPWELGEKADQLAAPPKNLKPEWFFLAMYVVLELVSKETALIIFTIIGAIWFFLPVIDRKTARGEKSNTVVIIGFSIMIIFIALTILGHFASPEWFSGLHS